MDLRPVVKECFILPPVSECVDKLHIEARVVGAFGKVVVRSAAIVHTVQLRRHNVGGQSTWKFGWSYRWTIRRQSTACHGR
jgi:Ser-tRNA(Ala) deacylase AlaX